MIIHVVNGFICSAFGFALFDMLHRREAEQFRPGPLFLAILALCFSITIGVFWELIEYGSDVFFKNDAMKDTVVHSIHSALLDPEGKTVIHIDDIRDTAVNGTELGLGGYLDIGLHDTMKDLLVNLAGAAIFSVIGYFYYKNGEKGKFALAFIPGIKYGDGTKPEK